MSRLLAALAAVALAAPSALAASAPAPIDLAQDRARAQDAAAIVHADERYLALQQRRVEDLRAAWDDEVAHGHPQEAGRLAVAHWHALQTEIHGRVALEHARRDFAVAREQLISDEYTVQQG